MSNTSRPLMGATITQNPAPIKQAPGLHSNLTDDPMEATVDGNNPVEPTVPQDPVQHDWEKRYKDLQSYSTKKLNSQDVEIARLATEAARGPKFQVPKTADELAAFKAENSETYAFIETIAHDIAQNQMQVYNDRLNMAETTLAKTTQEQALSELQRRHPDFQSIDGDPRFNQWLTEQDLEVQGWVVNNTDDAAKLCRALSLFKADTGWGVTAATNDTPQNTNIDASRAVEVPGALPDGSDTRTHPKYIWTESEISKMRPEEYSKYAADIDLAVSEGRIALG